MTSQNDWNSVVISQQEVEKLLSASPAPRVIPEQLNAKIKEVTFIRHSLLTICVIDLVNGYSVVGKSGCVSPENYNAEIGEHYSFKDALDQVWPLEGYLLAEGTYLQRKDRAGI